MLKARPEIHLVERYYTDDKIEVTNRIKDRRTLLFKGKNSASVAKAAAKSMRSYAYPIFVHVNHKGRHHVGYGVPK